MKLNRKHTRLIGLLLLPAIVVGLLTLPVSPSQGAAGTEPQNPYRAGAPNVDVNATAAAARQATSAQQTAINQFKTNYGSQTTVRWNSFAGSPDVISGFHTPPSTDTPENVARSFVAANTTLFGIDPSTLVVADKKEALGGYLVRFKQTSGGVDVMNGGLGFLMNADKQIRMVMGSSYRGVSLATTPSLSAEAAAVKAQTALAGYAITRSAGTEQMLKPAYDELAAQIAPALYTPKLNIFPTATGYKLAWNVIIE